MSSIGGKITTKYYVRLQPSVNFAERNQYNHGFCFDFLYP